MAFLPHFILKTLFHRPQVEQNNGRISLWMQEKADTDIAQAARKSWKRESCLKDIPKLRFKAFRPRNARSFAGQTLKVQTGAERNGLRWRYRRSRFWGKVGREGEMQEGGILKVGF
jgi:hypothetical protein